MLKICKNHSLKTSLLDDFMYYENRQKIMQEEKARLLIKSYGNSFLVPAFDPPRKQNFLLDMPYNEDEKTTKHNQLNSLEKTVHGVTEQVSLDPNISSSRMTKENDKHIANKAKHDDVSSLTIGSLTINPKQAETKPLDVPPNVSTVADAKPVDVVTVGSMPVRVNGFGDSSVFFTVGTIPVDPGALQIDEVGGAKSGSQL